MDDEITARDADQTFLDQLTVTCQEKVLLGQETNPHSLSTLAELTLSQFVLHNLASKERGTRRRHTKVVSNRFNCVCANHSCKLQPIDVVVVSQHFLALLSVTV
eukprot:313620-Amphidinium_carterae.1